MPRHISTVYKAKTISKYLINLNTDLYNYMQKHMQNTEMYLYLIVVEN